MAQPTRTATPLNVSHDSRGAGTQSRRRPLLAAAALLLATGCAGAGVSSSPAGAQSLGGGDKAVVVSLKTLKFTPKSITAKVNQRIDFRWDESVAHNVIFDKNRKSKTLTKKGAIWSTTFDKAGTYKFKCTLHPGMQGDVKVS